MTTAKDYYDSWKDGIYSIEDIMKGYAKLAISADRENVAKHSKACTSSNGQWVSAAVDAFVVKDSIINAPQIELL